jgi:hypothetical protein
MRRAPARLLPGSRPVIHLRSALPQGHPSCAAPHRLGGPRGGLGLWQRRIGCTTINRHSSHTDPFNCSNEHKMVHRYSDHAHSSDGRHWRQWPMKLIATGESWCQQCPSLLRSTTARGNDCPLLLWNLNRRSNIKWCISLEWTPVTLDHWTIVPLFGMDAGNSI